MDVKAGQASMHAAEKFAEDGVFDSGRMVIKAQAEKGSVWTELSDRSEQSPVKEAECKGLDVRTISLRDDRCFKLALVVYSESPPHIWRKQASWLRIQK